MYNNATLAAEKAARILSVEAGEGWPNEDLQTSNYFQWAVCAYPQLKFLLFHVPNKARNKIEGAKYHAQGVTSGIPDFILLSLHGGCVTGIELKLPSGVQSTSQKDCQLAWLAAGNRYYLVREFGAFREIIEGGI